METQSGLDQKQFEIMSYISFKKKFFKSHEFANTVNLKMKYRYHCDNESHYLFKYKKKKNPLLIDWTDTFPPLITFLLPVAETKTRHN